MNSGFPQKLKLLKTQLKISNVQLARGLNLDPSLISLWLKRGCGKLRAADHAIAIGNYVLTKTLSPENIAWLSAEVGTPLSPRRIAHWLQPEFVAPEENENPLPLVTSFHSAVEKLPEADSLFSVIDGTEKIVDLLHKEITICPDNSEINIFLSSEAVSFFTDRRTIRELEFAAGKKKLVIHILVQSANNSVMTSRLISACMPLLVNGQLTLSIIQGTPPIFTLTTNIILPGRAAVIVTETIHPHVTAVGTIIHDLDVVRSMQSGFENSKLFARPMMTSYDDSFAQNIVEIFFEEYGLPGNLDVIKSGMNPMYLTVEQYRKVLKEFNHPCEQYNWRSEQFAKFKEAMDTVLLTSSFREVLSLSMLRRIAETGTCRMPAMYFFETGIWHLNAQDCVNLFDGYIHFLKTVPNFQVLLLEDEGLFSPNSCWHIKNYKHIMIHSWNIDDPIMVYSDQLMLIEEFQMHFDSLWQKAVTWNSKRSVIQVLSSLRDQCAEKISARPPADPS